MRTRSFLFVGLGAGCLAVFGLTFTLPRAVGLWTRAFPSLGFHDYAGTTISRPARGGWLLAGVLLVALGLSKRRWDRG
jgi:hypothetical protein